MTTPPARTIITTHVTSPGPLDGALMPLIWRHWSDDDTDARTRRCTRETRHEFRRLLLEKPISQIPHMNWEIIDAINNTIGDAASGHAPVHGLLTLSADRFNALPWPPAAKKYILDVINLNGLRLGMTEEEIRPFLTPVIKFDMNNVPDKAPPRTYHGVGAFRGAVLISLRGKSNAAG